MKFLTKFEYRGHSSILSKDKTKSFTYVNVEDTNGESAKFLSDFDHDFPKLEKGKIYNFTLDYSTKYGSIKIVGVQ